MVAVPSSLVIRLRWLSSRSASIVWERLHPVDFASPLELALHLQRGAFALAARCRSMRSWTSVRRGARSARVSRMPEFET